MAQTEGSESTWAFMTKSTIKGIAIVCYAMVLQFCIMPLMLNSS